MIKGIVAFKIAVNNLQGKKKLSQNKTEAERLRIIETLSKSATSNEQLIAEYMKGDKVEDWLMSMPSSISLLKQQIKVRNLETENQNPGLFNQYSMLKTDSGLKRCRFNSLLKTKTHASPDSTTAIWASSCK